MVDALARPLRAHQIVEARDARLVAITARARARSPQVRTKVECRQLGNEGEVAVLGNLREEVAILADLELGIESAAQIAHVRADERCLPIEQRAEVHQRPVERATVEL